MINPTNLVERPRVMRGQFSTDHAKCLLISDRISLISNDIQIGEAVMAVSAFEWIVDQGGDVTFTQADAIVITGMKPLTFQNWANRDLLTPLLPKLGFKERRRYTAHNLVVIALANELTDLNVTAAASVVSAITIWMEALKGLSAAARKRTAHYSDLASAVAIIRAESKDKQNVLVCVDPTKVPFKDLLDGHPNIVLAIGPVIKRIASAAMEIEADERAEA